MDEREIWINLIDDDESALATLMRHHYKALVHFGFKYIRDEEFIKDCVQDLFIELWNRRKTVSIPDSARAYLCVCLKRKIFRNGSKLKIFTPFDQDVENNEPSIEFSPEWWLIREESIAERTREMTNLLNALPKRQREVVYLKYYQQMSRDEIAEAMSLAPQSVSNMLQTALGFLRQHGKTAFLSVILALIRS